MELEEVLTQEEMLWFQKAHAQWVQFGDRNTKFFHTKVIVQHRRIRIESLRNELGQWISDENSLRELAVR